MQREPKSMVLSLPLKHVSFISHQQKNRSMTKSAEYWKLKTKTNKTPQAHFEIFGRFVIKEQRAESGTVLYPSSKIVDQAGRS